MILIGPYNLKAYTHLDPIVGVVMSTLKGKKILVVDDEEGIRDLIISELEFCGAECVEASNGSEAFEIYKKGNFDAVISDVRMPNGDGLLFLQKVKDEKLPMKVIIFMTGFSEVPVEEIYDMGVEAIISKPFRLDHLVATLEIAMVTPRVVWRGEPRVVSIRNITLTYKSQADVVSARTFNMGKGGMFVQLNKTLPLINEKVNFRFEYDVESETPKVLTGEMIVRWVRKEPSDTAPTGFGAEFVGMTQEGLDEISVLAGLVKYRGFIPKN